MVFYIVDGEASEDLRHPNAFMVEHEAADLVLMGDFMRDFPIEGEGMELAFRVEASQGKSKFISLDEGDVHQPLPFHRGVLFSRVRLRDATDLRPTSQTDFGRRDLAHQYAHHAWL